MDDLTALAGKKYQDGIEQANKGPRGDILQKDAVVPIAADEPLKRKTRDDSSAQRDSKEHGNADGDCRVRYRDIRLGLADDVDEEDSQWCIKDDLQDGVDGHQDRAVLIITAG